MKNIYIIGAGAIGKPLAVILQRHQRKVVLVRASEAVPASMQRLAVLSGNGDLIEEEIAVRALKDITRFDGPVLIATKSYGNFELADALSHKVAGSPVVIMQNGLGVEEAFLRDGPGNLYRCILFVTGHYGDNGQVIFRTVMPSQIGVVRGSRQVLEEVVAAINTPLFPFASTEDIRTVVWSKAIANCVFNSVCSVLDIDNGIFHRSEEALGIAKSVIAECVAVAALEGVRLSVEEMTGRVLQISRVSDGQLISTLQDIRNGRPTEIDTLNFAVARVAAAHGAEGIVPVTKALGELTKLKSMKI